MRKLVYCAALVCLLFHIKGMGQGRFQIDFNADWKFKQDDDSAARYPLFDDSKWRKLSLPHDWSIEADFNRDAPATNMGGSLPGGTGWYRKAFVLPANARNKNIDIEFGGVYQNSEVWINGHYLGKRPNGYISFSYDLTPYLNAAPHKNYIAVKVDNSLQPNSRWYSGSGIYRNVKLHVTDYIFIAQYGTFITTPVVDKTASIIEVTTLLETSRKENQDISLLYSIYGPSGKLIKKISPVDFGLYFEGSALVKKIKIEKPLLWSVSNPNLYTLKTQVFRKGQLMDEESTVFGFRSAVFNLGKGFLLNNVPVKIKGVCMHHDFGALGAAFNSAAARRQLNMLKDMGCNAIRFSHNPPATEMLDLCDQMGFLVVDEAFDMWRKKKNKYDYAKDFKDWHRKDLEDQIKRDRNHPSVILWSIGNEIREQFDSTGLTITKELVDIVKSLDNTRPVTAALTETDTAKNFVYLSNALDIPGWNYRHAIYADYHKNYPGKKFIALETASAFQTRGVYHLPADSVRIMPEKGKIASEYPGTDYTTSAYDNTYAYWGSTHEAPWKIIKANQNLSGLFVWSGFDYLGEPTPFFFPARSSYFGIIDMAGFPKDIYYMYQSEWNTKPVLHIFPHWNWPQTQAGQPAQIVDIWAYYNNADEVELFLNGRSVGIQKKINDDLHVQWRIPFQAGTLKAISRKKGKIVLIKEIKTAGKPAKIELTADRKSIKAGGSDLSFITAKILDGDGTIVPDADNRIAFSVSDNGTIEGTDNGYQADTVSFKSHQRKAWKGMALTIISAAPKKGYITIRATAAGLKPAEITLKSN